MNKLDRDLLLACKDGEAHLCVHLLDQGADANVVDEGQWTALHWASMYGHSETCLTLLDRGADVNAVDGSQGTALHLASMHGHTETCLSLVASQADTEGIMSKHEDVRRVLGLSQLSAAIELGHGPALLKVLQEDAEPLSLNKRVRNAVKAAHKLGMKEGPQMALAWLAARSARHVIGELTKDTASIESQRP